MANKCVCRECNCRTTDECSEFPCSCCHLEESKPNYRKAAYEWNKIGEERRRQTLQILGEHQNYSEFPWIDLPDDLKKKLASYVI